MLNTVRFQAAYDGLGPQKKQIGQIISDTKLGLNEQWRQTSSENRNRLSNDQLKQLLDQQGAFLYDLTKVVGVLAERTQNLEVLA
jgi:hypothetical protein